MQGRDRDCARFYHESLDFALHKKSGKCVVRIPQDWFKQARIEIAACSQWKSPFSDISTWKHSLIANLSTPEGDTTVWCSRLCITIETISFNLDIEFQILLVKDTCRWDEKARWAFVGTAAVWPTPMRFCLLPSRAEASFGHNYCNTGSLASRPQLHTDRYLEIVTTSRMPMFLHRARPFVRNQFPRKVASTIRMRIRLAHHMPVAECTSPRPLCLLCYRKLVTQRWTHQVQPWSPFQLPSPCKKSC